MPMVPQTASTFTMWLVTTPGVSPFSSCRHSGPAELHMLFQQKLRKCQVARCFPLVIPLFDCARRPLITVAFRHAHSRTSSYTSTSCRAFIKQNFWFFIELDLPEKRSGDCFLPILFIDNLLFYDGGGVYVGLFSLSLAIF